MKHLYVPFLLSVSALAVSSTAAAAPEAEPEKYVTLDVNVGVVSAYVWRGINMFQSSKQMDQHAMLSPSFTVALPETGLSFGYWSAYQLNGDNRSALIDLGLGAEQDLIVGYELALNKQLTAAFALTYYFFPFADKEVAGTSLPSYLEPSASITYSTAADLGLLVAYYHAVQDEIKVMRHAYVSPSVSKSFELSETVGLEPKASVGYKLFNDRNVKDYVYDVTLGVGVPIAATKSISVTPSVNAAWANLSDVSQANGAVEKRGFGDEYVVWGGLNIGFPVL